MQYSPKLKKVIAEINEILIKNDVAGIVAIHTPGFTEYLNYISPSYSCAKAEEGGIRFRLKSAEVGNEKARFIAESTYNMISHFADISGMYALAYLDAHNFLKEKWRGTDFDGEHTSHDQQNN